MPSISGARKMTPIARPASNNTSAEAGLQAPGRGSASRLTKIISTSYPQIPSRTTSSRTKNKCLQAAAIDDGSEWDKWYKERRESREGEETEG
jgi:hypothetical protein